MNNTSSMTTLKAGIRRIHLIATGALLMLLPDSSFAAEVLNNADSGPGSLRQTVADTFGGETIMFSGALSGSTITLTGGQIAVDKGNIVLAQ